MGPSKWKEAALAKHFAKRSYKFKRSSPKPPKMNNWVESTQASSSTAIQGAIESGDAVINSPKPNGVLSKNKSSTNETPVVPIKKKNSRSSIEEPVLSRYSPTHATKHRPAKYEHELIAAIDDDDDNQSLKMTDYCRNVEILYHQSKPRKQGATNAIQLDTNNSPLESLEDYRGNIRDVLIWPSDAQHKITQRLTDQKYLPRVRRIMYEGSYDNFSVDEKKLRGDDKEMLRLTWKGKLLKLQRCLGEARYHKWINNRDPCMRTALHYAASWDNPEIMKALLRVPGIKVDLQDDDGNTALHKAVEVNSYKCVQLLMQHGASALIKARDNRNPFELALQVKGDTALDIIRYLFMKGDMSSQIADNGVVSYLHMLSLANKNVEVHKTAHALINLGVFINCTEGKGRTPLMTAVTGGKTELVKLLMECKADFMHKDLNKKAAIDYAKRGTTIYHIIEAAISKKLNDEIILKEHANWDTSGTSCARPF